MNETKWTPKIGDEVYVARDWEWNSVVKGTLKPKRVIRTTGCYVWTANDYSDNGDRHDMARVYPDLRTLALHIIDDYQDRKSAANREADSWSSKIDELRKVCQ